MVLQYLKLKKRIKMEKTILENQLIIMKSLFEVVGNVAIRMDLKKQIQFTAARIKSLI